MYAAFYNSHLHVRVLSDMHIGLVYGKTILRKLRVYVTSWLLRKRKLPV